MGKKTRLYSSKQDIFQFWSIFHDDTNQYYDFMFSNLSCSYAWGFNSRENNALLSWAYLHISFLTAYFKVKAIKHISGKQNDFLKILISSHLSQISFLWVFLDTYKENFKTQIHFVVPFCYKNFKWNISQIKSFLI